MKKKKSVLVFLALLLAVSVSVLSAHPTATTSHALSKTAEAALSGGDNCVKAIGVAGGLALGGLSPCSVVCWGSAAVVTFFVIVICT